MKEEQVKLKPSAFHSIMALTKAAIISTLRNPTSMFFSFFFPFIFITIFGILNYNNVSYDLGIKSSSLKSGPIYEALKQVSTVHLITDETDNQLTDGLKKGTIPMVIDIQNETSLAVAPGQDIPRYHIDIETSAAAPDQAGTLNAILENITNKINFSVLKASNTLISTSSTEVSGRKYQQIDFILPGQLAFALLTNALFGIAYTFVSMKKELILKRFFATPIKKSWIMASQIISKMLISVIQTLVILGAGYFIFNFTLANGAVTVLSILILSIIGMITFLSFGIFTAAVSKNEDSVTPITQLFLMPQLFLSGAFFPIEAFPAFIQPIARILPMTLLNDAFKMVAFEGAPISQTLPQILGLVVWAIIVYAITAKLFKWE